MGDKIINCLLGLLLFAHCFLVANTWSEVRQTNRFIEQLVEYADRTSQQEQPR